MGRKPQRSYPSRSLWHPAMGRCTVHPFKRGYPERKQAEKAVRVFGGSKYRCEACGLWHLTSYPPRVQAAITMLLESIKADRAKGVKA